MPQNNEPSFKVQFSLIFLLTFVYSLSFFSSVLNGDEVFVVFSFGPELSQSPDKVISWAINSSTAGLNTGRFISPISHILSNAGVLLSYKSSQFLLIDVITANAIWRSLLTSVISILAMLILLRFIPKSLPLSEKKFQLSLFAVVFPIVMVTNSSWSATRISIWSYHILLILTMVLLWTYLLISTIDKTHKSKFQKVLITLVAPAFLGVAFATTYELSMALAPLAMFAFSSVRWINSTRNSNMTTGIIRNFGCRENVVFFLFFLVPFLMIRIHSFMYCSNNICYGPANLTTSGFAISNLLERAVSALPIISIPIGLNKDLSLANSPFLIFGSAIVGILFVLVLRSFSDKYYGSNFDPSLPNLTKWRLLVGLLGVLIILLVATGMSLSETIQQNQDPLDAIVSNRDTLALNLAVSYIFFALFSVLVSKLRVGFDLPRHGLYLFVFVFATLGFLSNTVVTKDSLVEPGKMLQVRFATELSRPDLTNLGDSRRCSLVKQKLSDYPEWRNHDLMLFSGLNLAMTQKAGVPFCSESIESLFADYVD
jgi:hypothetical protein